MVFSGFATIIRLYDLFDFNQYHRAARSCLDQIAQDVISRALVMMGIASITQSLWRGPIGSGYLAPARVVIMYFGPSLQAVSLGGLPMLFGMLIIAGIIQMLFSSNE